jgi:hypothetical protein
MITCIEDNCPGLIAHTKLHTYHKFTIVAQEHCLECKKPFILQKDRRDNFEKHVSLFFKISRMGLSTGCDLVLMFSPFDEKKIDDLLIISSTAYVRSRDDLFYVNKAKKEYIKVELTPEQLKTFDLEMEPAIGAITLTKKQLQKITSIIGCSYDENINLEKMEEVFAQFILLYVLSEYKIILMDNGSKGGQYDLLAINDRHSIAIEVTQATNQKMLEATKYFEEKGNTFFEEGLKYNWVISVKSAMSKSDRNKLITILKKIEAHHIPAHHTPNFNFHFHYNHHNIAEYTELKCKGVISLHASFVEEKAEEKGSIQINGPFDVNNKPDELAIFQIVHAEAWKEDNIKKLESARTHEHHLFIAITGYHNNAALYLQIMGDKSHNLTLEELSAKLGFLYDLPKIIDVIWVATFANFSKGGKIGFLLAKITNHGTYLSLEPMTKSIVSYESCLNCCLC